MRDREPKPSTSPIALRRGRWTGRRMRSAWRNFRAAIGVGLCLASPTLAADGKVDHSHAAFTVVLQAHVTDGKVDYRELKAAPQRLGQYLDALAAVSESQFKTWSKPEQVAYLVNLYNAATLKLVADHYPVGSIKDIGGFFKGPWDLPVVRLFGEGITLNNLEHDILRKDFADPRLHMVLVCAARGCPPLRPEAYVAGRLEEQLDAQSRTYLQSPRGLQIDRDKGEARISAIFRWYKEDFPSVPAFVSRHSGRNLDGLRIRYIDYDWGLNEQ